MTLQRGVVELHLFIYNILQNIKQQKAHSQRLHVLLRMQSRQITKSTGNTDAANRPLWILFSAEPVQRPTMDGPTVPPTSPARAKSAKSAVPPWGILADVRLIEPGHIIATARPLNIQPIKEISGIGDNDANR